MSRYIVTQTGWCEHTVWDTQFCCRVNAYSCPQAARDEADRLNAISTMPDSARPHQ